jgi:hypothetical protein
MGRKRQGQKKTPTFLTNRKKRKINHQLTGTGGQHYFMNLKPIVTEK